MGYSVTNQDLLDLVRQTITLMGGDPSTVTIEEVAALRLTILRRSGADHVIELCKSTFPHAFPASPRAPKDVQNLSLSRR